MKLPVTIDPRYHDAVIFDLDGVVTAFDSAAALVQKLQEIGVATAVYSSNRICEHVLRAAGIGDLFSVRVDGLVADELGLPGKRDHAVLLEAAQRLGARPERSVVVEGAIAGVEAGRSGGFAFVIGVDWTGNADELLRAGADAVVTDLADIAVHAGDRPMSRLPNALDSYGQLIGVIAGRRPVVFLDYDGTLSEIVSDPGAATLVDGAAKTLEHLATLCPVAILSGRDLADVRSRVGIPGIWYAGSHGFELIGPDGAYHQNDAAAAAVPVLESAAVELRDGLGHIPGVRWNTSASPSRCTTATSHRSTSVRSSQQHPARTTRRPTSVERPQVSRAAAGYRLGQGHHAGLDP